MLILGAARPYRRPGLPVFLSGSLFSYRKFPPQVRFIRGIQQGYEISSEDGLDIYPSVSVKAYPNPVTDYLILSFSSFDLYGIKVILTDSKGVFLRLSEIVEAESRIDMASLSAGVYFLKVLKDNRLLKTFKILKK